MLLCCLAACAPATGREVRGSRLASTGRDVTACTAIDRDCRAITAAVLSGGNAARHEADRIIDGMTALSAGRSSTWTALHLRAFNCVLPASAASANSTSASTFPASSDGVAGGALDLKVLPRLLERVGVPSGYVYVVSSVPIEDVQRALNGTRHQAVGKERFLGRHFRQQTPFEGLASIDFEISTRAPVYVGEPGGRSSFDAFVETQRTLMSRSAMLPISEAEYCARTAACRRDHGSECPPFAG